VNIGLAIQVGRRPKVDRRQVLTAARALFGERGYEGTTLAAIAGRVGVTPSALLRHAATKQELFAAAFAPQAPRLRLPIEFLSTVDAAKRDPAAVLRDVRNEILSAERAKADYGVIVDTKAWRVDMAATRERRAQIRAARGWRDVPKVQRHEPAMLTEAAE